MQNLIKIFKLMSDETRLRVITLLYQDELCVCQLSGITGIAQPKVSKALSKLRDLDLVIDNRQEKFVYYTLKKDHPIVIMLINEIINNIDKYPILKDDQNKVKDKTTYLKQCNTTITL